MYKHLKKANAIIFFWNKSNIQSNYIHHSAADRIRVNLASSQKAASSISDPGGVDLPTYPERGSMISVDLLEIVKSGSMIQVNYGSRSTWSDTGIHFLDPAAFRLCWLRWHRHGFDWWAEIVWIGVSVCVHLACIRRRTHKRHLRGTTSIFDPRFWAAKIFSVWLTCSAEYLCILHAENHRISGD